MGTYKYSYRFNARHNTSMQEGGAHTHSFEVVFYIRQQEKFFFEAESMINDYMSKYVGADLNEILLMVPTIENIAETIYEEINVLSIDFEVVRMEMSDSPVQTYIIGAEEF